MAVEDLDVKDRETWTQATCPSPVQSRMCQGFFHRSTVSPSSHPGRSQQPPAHDAFFNASCPMWTSSSLDSLSFSKPCNT